MSEYSEFFKFAAKVGSLEGYLFKRDEAEPLTNWVGNIEKMYQGLPAAVRKDVKEELQAVLQKILEYGDRVLEPGLKQTLSKLLKTVQTGS